MTEHQHKPPKDADPSELWVKLSELPRQTSKPFEFKRGGEVVGELLFWVLTASELESVRSNADKAAAEFCGVDSVRNRSLSYEEVYEQEKGAYLLALACRQPKNPLFPVFPNAKAVRQVLTDDEMAVILLGYAHFRRESGPIISELTKEELEAWVRVLKEGASRAPLARCSGEALTDLIMYLVSILPTSPTPTSSAGSPQGGSSTRTEGTLDDTERALLER